MICPTCGSSCPTAWCDFCDHMLPLHGCAVGGCTDPDCWICVGMQEAFRVVRCSGKADGGEPCRFVAGHPNACQPMSKRKRDANVERGGEPATKRRDPTFTPRRRVGPHR